jgi:hypothetical protein
MPPNINDLQYHTYRNTPESFDPLATSTAVVNPDGTPIFSGSATIGTVNQGDPGSIGESWYVELTNGTNVIGTIANPIVSAISGTVTVVQPVGSNLNVSISNFPGTQPISGTVTANQGTPNTLADAWPVEITDGTNVLGTVAHPLNVEGVIVVSPGVAPTTNTNYNVASSASSVTLLPINANRKQASIYNDSTQILYLNAEGDTASATHYTVQIYPNGLYELPTSDGGTIYTGAITGIWVSANGFARVTETTP